MPPRQLREVVDEAIASMVDQHELELLTTIEAEERHWFQRLANRQTI